ncbi:HlyD family efflux transporter periplasmic adaptor subunit [Actinoallomurus sp. NBC_01490]|uniref:efflux RND transporter periplasmic adaptor subunit n=1 Tax=Actinoallomurus sp. NBC_01490 TaxID=2903557 RepID=UPI002E3522F1|nr:HlyD family efflux transporter periplasmic adaptor subunit [Actinoallomurus sp. NBC_01490]
MKRLLRRRVLLLNGALAVLLAVGIGVGYLSLSDGNDAAGASSTRTARVARGNVVSSVSASGSVASSRTRSLTFGTSGTVTKIYVAAGDKVEKGKVLARLDRTAAEENVTSAKASLAAAESGDTSSASGHSQYVSAKNSYEQAVRALEGTRIVAPFGGTIVAVNGTVGGSSSGSGSSSSGSSSSGQGSTGASGSSASSGSDASSSSGFIELADPSRLEVAGEFTESDATKLKTGQSATVSFDALTGVTATGEVTQIDMSPTTSDNVVQYGATVELTDPPSSLRLGQTATVRVTTASAENVLYVPAAAVKTAGGQSTVTVQQGGKQVVEQVRIGVSGDQGTEIKSGLNEGDEVVITTTSSSGGSGSSGGFPGGGGGGIGGPGGGIGGGGRP